MRTIRCLLVAGVVGLFAIALGACSQPETAGNAVWEFVTAAQTSDHERAVSLLCAELRVGLSAEEFDRSENEIAPPLRLTRLVGSDSDAQEDLETTKSDIASASVAVEGTGPTGPEHWRIHLTKEDGEWKVCEFERL